MVSWLALIGVMDELKRFRISRRGYHTHTTKLLSGIPESLTAKYINEELASTIKLTLEQLQQK